MDTDTTREFFTNVATWLRGDTRAPHELLLLPNALGRIYQEAPRLAPQAKADECFRHLLREFGPPRKSHHPELLAWHRKEVFRTPERQAEAR